MMIIPGRERKKTEERKGERREDTVADGRIAIDQKVSPAGRMSVVKVQTLRGCFAMLK